jgi:hypothetical protein
MCASVSHAAPTLMSTSAGGHAVANAGGRFFAPDFSAASTECNSSWSSSSPRASERSASSPRPSDESCDSGPAVAAARADDDDKDEDKDDDDSITCIGADVAEVVDAAEGAHRDDKVGSDEDEDDADEV